MRRIFLAVALAALLGAGCAGSSRVSNNGGVGRPLASEPHAIQAQAAEIKKLALTDESMKNFVEGQRYIEPNTPPEEYVDSINYGDVTGDQFEEAWLEVPSGGTAGIIAVLVYGLKNGGVYLMEKISGYKIQSVESQSGQLVITQPRYLKEDANCCPSFMQKTSYRWSGQKFEALKTTEERLSY